jgi:hypothetical protein
MGVTMARKSSSKARSGRSKGSAQVPKHWFHSYNFCWITLGLFIFSLAGHWLFGWFAYVDEQLAHNQEVEVGQYMVEMTRDTLENWQSEFLQLLWQVGGLAFLFFVGSPQSKEGSERMEAKVDAILRKVDPQGDSLIAHLDESFAKTPDEMP